MIIRLKKLMYLVIVMMTILKEVKDNLKTLDEKNGITILSQGDETKSLFNFRWHSFNNSISRLTENCIF